MKGLRTSSSAFDLATAALESSTSFLRLRRDLGAA